MTIFRNCGCDIFTQVFYAIYFNFGALHSYFIDLEMLKTFTFLFNLVTLQNGQVKVNSKNSENNISLH